LAQEFGRLKNIANIGDIIEINGYPGKRFRVTEFTYEITYSSEYIDESITYNVFDIETGEYEIAFQEDITVVKSDNKTDKKDEEQSEYGEDLTNEERIDRLLMAITDYQMLIEIFGDDDGEYSERIKRVKSALSEIVGKEDD